MISKIAYDVHIKPNLQPQTIDESYILPDAINNSSIISSSGWTPNERLLCNGVLTSRGTILYPCTGNGDTAASSSGDIYENNDAASFMDLMYSNEERTFDFFDPSTNTFVPWTLYTADYSSGSINGMELRWKDANGNNPPTLYGITNYICRVSNRNRSGGVHDGIVVLFNFDGYAYNPFSDTDPIVAKMSIQYQTYNTNTLTWSVGPKLNGARYRNTYSQTRRCMPYQFAYRSGTYDLTDATTAKAIAFGMTNWVKIHDNFKQYITKGLTETVSEFEYTKYLEFSDL